MHGAVLTGANLAGAQIRGANFGRYEIPSDCGPKAAQNSSCGTVTDGISGGITLAQLSTTASYLAHELSGVDFSNNNLAGGNFAGKVLSNATFLGANLTNADFRHAKITNVLF